jgi:hypothetical protein
MHVRAVWTESCTGLSTGGYRGTRLRRRVQCGPAPSATGSASVSLVVLSLSLSLTDSQLSDRQGWRGVTDHSRDCGRCVDADADAPTGSSPRAEPSPSSFRLPSLSSATRVYPHALVEESTIDPRSPGQVARTPLSRVTAALVEESTIDPRSPGVARTPVSRVTTALVDESIVDPRSPGVARTPVSRVAAVAGDDDSSTTGQMHTVDSLQVRSRVALRARWVTLRALAGWR